jgi:hypothetical protein
MDLLKGFFDFFTPSEQSAQQNMNQTMIQNSINNLQAQLQTTT